MKTRFQTYLFIFTILLLTACGQDNQETESNNPPPLSNYNLPANIQKSTEFVIARTIDVATVTEPFNMIISANPEFYSYRGGGNNCPPEPPETSSEDCVRRMSLKSNADQYFAMKSLGQDTNNDWWWPNSGNLATSLHSFTVTKPVGLIINGSLVASWHYHASKNYEVPYLIFYDPINIDYLIPGIPTLKRVINTIYSGMANPGLTNPNATFDTLALTDIYNYYPGLGHSDYDYNLSCKNRYSDVYAGYACAYQAVNYLESKLLGDSDSGRFGGADDYHPGSLSYYFDIGNHRFIQLNNYPTYQINFHQRPYRPFRVQSSITWLRNTLESSGSKRIVLNMSDYGSLMYSPSGREPFLTAIADAREKIVALFAGYTFIFGWVGTVPCRVGESSCSEIPFFNSGSADHNTFLLANFGSNSMSVGTISSEVWTKTQNVFKVPEIQGTSPSEYEDMNATYISLDECSAPELGDRTYVTFNSKEGTVRNNIAGTMNVHYSSFKVEVSSPQDPRSTDYSISIQDTDTIPGANALGAPALVANSNTIFAFWRAYNGKTKQNNLVYSVAPCDANAGSQLRWSQPTSLMALFDGNYEGGISAKIHNNKLYLIYPGQQNYWMNTFGLDLPLTRSSLTRMAIDSSTGSNKIMTRPSFWVNNNHLNLVSFISESVNDSKDVIIYIQVFDNIGESNQGSYSFPVVSPTIRYSSASYRQNQYTAYMQKQYHAIASFPSGKTVSLYNFIGGDIGYEINNVPLASIPLYNIVSKSKVYGQLVKKIGNGTIQSRGGVAIARSNDPNKLIAFYRDAQNSDLYASIFLGEPHFMRSTTNSVDATLLKTYYK